MLKASKNDDDDDYQNDTKKKYNKINKRRKVLNK